jgi:hypothetical protein
MDVKELKINSWLDAPVHKDFSDNLGYYIDNGNDNYTFCENVVSDVINLIESEAFIIMDKNLFRDDVIELIYKYSNEP